MRILFTPFDSKLSKKQVSLALTGVLAFLASALVTFPATAGESVDKTLDASDKSHVEIHNVRGDISVKGWDKSQVKVSGKLDDLAEKFVFKSDGDKVYIKVKLPRHSNNHSGRGSKLKIYVPQNASVQFGGVATDLNFSAIGGDVDINSVSGDIDLKDIGGSLYINSVSGDIQLNDIDGDLEVTSVSGYVKGKVSSEKLEISAVSSDISIATEHFDVARISNVSGDSDIYGKLADDGEIRMSNVSGDSFYHLSSELNAKVVLDTGPGGDILNQYSDDRPSKSFIGSEKLKFSAGDGEGRVRMSTVSGEIGLKKK